MLRVLVFGAASLVVFFGLTTALPILEEGMDVGQFATVSYYFDDEESAQPADTTRSSEVEELPELSCIISVHPNNIARGESASVAWGSENAFSASLSGVGDVSVQGGVFVSPLNTSAYTLTVRSHSGGHTICRTWITVR